MQSTNNVLHRLAEYRILVHYLMLVA